MTVWAKGWVTKMRVYLAGPMRGIKAYNHPAFDRAAAKLRDEGHEVFSPAEHDRDLWPDLDWPNFTGDLAVDGFSGVDMRKVIKADLDWIADIAEAIALLPGWENSRGACTEHALGIFLGLWIRKL